MGGTSSSPLCSLIQARVTPNCCLGVGEEESVAEALLAASAAGAPRRRLTSLASCLNEGLNG